MYHDLKKKIIITFFLFGDSYSIFFSNKHDIMKSTLHHGNRAPPPSGLQVLKTYLVDGCGMEYLSKPKRLVSL
jgi:hypothetical protein